MKVRSLASVLAAMCAYGATGDQRIVATVPLTFELYSWRSAGSSDWQCALLYNTSRLKQPEEIFDRKHQLGGIGALEKAIAAAPPKSTIYWFGQLVGLDGKPLKGTEALAYPP